MKSLPSLNPPTEPSRALEPPSQCSAEPFADLPRPFDFIKKSKEFSLQSLIELVDHNQTHSSSLLLEAGKALQAVVERFPEAKTIAAAYRSAGGEGSPPAHATLTRRVFAGLVITEFLSEREYDASNVYHHRFASGIVKLIEKEGEKFSEHRDDLLTATAQILRNKPSDAVNQLQELRRQTNRFAGIEQPNPSFTEVDKFLEKHLPVLLEDNEEIEATRDLLASWLARFDAKTDAQKNSARSPSQHLAREGSQTYGVSNSEGTPPTQNRKNVRRKMIFE